MITDILQIIEILYYISGIGIFLIGIFALKQIRIARNETIIRSKRDAANITREQINFYIEKIFPLFHDCREIMDNIDSLELDINEFNQNEVLSLFIKKHGKEKLNDWLLFHLDDKNVPKFNDILNKLEAFSAPFIEGIADEPIGFNSLGLEYCRVVKQISPYLAMFRKKDIGVDFYDNTIKLYQLWNKKIKNLEQKKNQDSLKKELMDILQKVSDIDKTTSEDNNIKPIGT